jgi:dATP pyrophosphohydrolase
LPELKRPESALVVIYDDRYRVLLLQRNDDPNFWQSVTGTIETGEAPIQAAYREVAEETGIRLNSSRFEIQDCHTTNQFRIRNRWLHRYPPGVTVNTEYVFATCVKSGTVVTLTEHSAFEWLDKPQATDRVWSETNRLAIQQFVPDHPITKSSLKT